MQAENGSIIPKYYIRNCEHFLQSFYLGCRQQISHNIKRLDKRDVVHETGRSMIGTLMNYLFLHSLKNIDKALAPLEKID